MAYPFPSAVTEALVDCSTERLRRLYPISTPKDDTSSHAQAITNAKSDAESKAKNELKRQDKLKQQSQANFLTPPLGAGLPSGLVPPLIPHTKMEIEPKPQVGPPLRGADILKMARTILDELIHEGFTTETQSHVFKQQIEQEYIQGDLRKEYPLLGSWPESRRSEIKDKIYTVIAQKMETSIIQAIQHETSVSKQSITSETVSNPVGPSHADFLSMPSVHNLGVNLASFGVPPVPVINLNEPEQPMEISQDQSRGSVGRRALPRQIPSTQWDRNAVIKEAKKIGYKKSTGVPNEKSENYKKKVKAYIKNLKTDLLSGKSWTATELTEELNRIYAEIMKIAVECEFVKPNKTPH